MISHDPLMTLTYFRARSTWIAYAFEWGKLLKCQRIFEKMIINFIIMIHNTYTENFLAENFIEKKKKDNFNIFVQNIHCGYSL